MENSNEKIGLFCNLSFDKVNKNEKNLLVINKIKPNFLFKGEEKEKKNISSQSVQCNFSKKIQEEIKKIYPVKSYLDSNCEYIKFPQNKLIPNIISMDKLIKIDKINKSKFNNSNFNKSFFNNSLNLSDDISTQSNFNFIFILK